MSKALAHISGTRSAPALLACDLGGTRLKLGIVRGRDLLAQRDLAAKPELGLEHALHRILTEQPSLSQQAQLHSSTIAALALAFPGIIHPQTQRILSVPEGKFDDAPSMDVGTWVCRKTGWASYVGNDANAALAGEWQYGAAVDCNNVVMMTLGTGIGSSVIVQAHPLRGVHGQAGCLGGHLLANVDGSPCQCGAVGCIETEASTWSLARRARAHPNFHKSALRTEPTLDYEAVFRLGAADDPVAQELRDRSVRTWSAAAVSLVHAYDPELLVVGGGIMRSETWIIPKLRAYVAQHAWTPWGQVQVVPARLGENAGLLGIAWQAQQHLTSR